MSTELPVEPAGDEGALAGALASVGGPGPAVAIAIGIAAALGLLLWFLRRRRADDDDMEDDRRHDRHERFDLGLDMRVAPEPPAAPPPPAERAPFAPAPEPVAPAPEPVAAPQLVEETPAPVEPPPPLERVPFAPVAPAPPPPVPEEVTPSPPPLPTAGRAMLGIMLSPRRAGTNLTSAAAEYDVVVRNSGGTAAVNIRLDVRLLSAGAQQDALIAALLAEPVGRPITPPFDLAVGTEVSLGGMGILPRERIVTMTVEGRELFVPVITVNLTYDWAGGSGQTARSFVIGIERGAGGKLGAFRLDEVRMYAEVGALEYTIAVDR